MNRPRSNAKNSTAKLGRTLINYARGGNSYHELRWRISTNVLLLAREKLPALPPHLRDKLFSIGNRVFICADIGNRDRKYLARLATNRNAALEDNLLALTIDYAMSNIDRVRALLEADARASKLILERPIDELKSVFDELSGKDRQSLWAFRLFSANSASHSRIIDYFSGNGHSDWVRQRLLYPLVYYCMNQPSDEFLPEALRQIFPEFDKEESERTLVTFLLRDDLADRVGLAYKCYVGLLCHPFDAVEMICSHLETMAARAETPRKTILQALAPLAELLPGSRLEALLRLFGGPSVFTDTPEVTGNWAEGAARETIQVLQDFWRFDATRPAVEVAGLLPSIIALRWSRYPTHKDFDEVHAHARRYLTTSAGRALHAMMTSLYMWERGSDVFERKSLVWQAELTGSVTPFLVTSPRGGSPQVVSLFGLDGKLIETQITRVMETMEPSARTWIKQFHWNQRSNIEAMRMRAWAADVRQAMPISCNNRFLSGIDWRWLDGYIHHHRAAPFRGEPNAIYVLFLRFIEEFKTQDPLLNAALMPFAKAHPSVSAFADWLVSEYGEAALGLVRIFLRPGTILRLRLESTFMAALTERVATLERLSERYGFPSDLMTADQLSAEQRALITTVTTIRLGPHQFEVPWSLLQADAIENAMETHRVYSVLSESYRTFPVLGQAYKRGYHSFANDQLHEYELPNSSWPLASVIFELMDTFMSHSSYGIEAILAVRIRHDNFRREFADTMGELGRTGLHGVRAAHRFELIPKFEQPIYDAVQAWVDAHMHTGTKGRKATVFDFVPSQFELDDLLKAIPPKSSAQAISDVVFGWLRDKLAASLSEARRLIDAELKPALSEAINTTVESVSRDWAGDRDAVSRLGRIVLSAIDAKATSLHEWFEWQSSSREGSVNHRSLAVAMQEKFRPTTKEGELSIQLSKSPQFEKSIPHTHVRQVLDVWQEMILNAVKYSKIPHVRMRVTTFQSAEGGGLLFSSRRRTSIDVEDRLVRGDPRSSCDSQFKDKESGHAKVAAIAAALCRKPIEVRIVTRQRSYHVFVPMPSFEAELEELAA